MFILYISNDFQSEHILFGKHISELVMLIFCNGA